jgi:predicted HD superfamily hydrolase involved in NAD metabolism
MIKGKIEQDLQQVYKNKPHRLQHVYGVVNMAVTLGKRHQCDIEKLELAALLHDITKYYSTEEHCTLIESYFPNSTYIIKEFNTNILHAFSAVVVANRTYGITDPFILGAIEHHTIGKPAMNIYEQILFVSDYIEPNRVYESCQRVRDIAFKSLDLATYTAIDDSITHYEQENGHIPHVAYQARDYYKQKLEETT